MSLTSYTGLVAAAASSWMARSDLTSQADDFIGLFESDFNANVRCRQMEAQTQITSTSGYLIHPTSWIGWKILKGTIGSKTYVLEPATDEVAINRTVGQSTAIPLLFKVLGDKTYLYPAASGVVITANYYAPVPALTGSASTNWLLTKYPGAYLFGMLIMSNLFLSDPRYQDWVSAYGRIVKSIKDDSRKAEWSGQSLRMQTDMRVV